MSISIRKSTGEAGYVATALVTSGRDRWFESRLFIGYAKREVAALFRAAMKQSGYTIEPD